MKKSRRRRPPRLDHSQCDVYIKPRGPHQGMYCCQHNAWIQWISAADLDSLRDKIKLEFRS
jgi:hypothetical protein